MATNSYLHLLKSLNNVDQKFHKIMETISANEPNEVVSLAVEAMYLKFCLELLDHIKVSPVLTLRDAAIVSYVIDDILSRAEKKTQER
jgi:hypothetical protein